MGSFDGHLLSLAAAKGANIIRGRVAKVDMCNGWPLVEARGAAPRSYDLVAVTAGADTTVLNLLEELETGYQPPSTLKTGVREFYLGEELVEQYMGSAVHVFLLNIPRLEFAALIPKGDFVTLCMIGEDLDEPLVQVFLSRPEVRGRFPPDYDLGSPACRCSPMINSRGAKKPYSDRVVFIGDSGVTRYYKDGIGSAYRSAKAAAVTAVFQGISAADFDRHCGPVCRGFKYDNIIAKLMFAVIRQIQRWRFGRRAILRMLTREQRSETRPRRLSSVMWDMYTGSSPYREMLLRTVHPVFLGRMVSEMVLSMATRA